MNSIQNPSIRILLLIKTLTLNQLKKKKKKPQVYLAWLDWLWGPWERLCKTATAQWNRSDLQSEASPRTSPTSPSPSSLNSRTQSATFNPPPPPFLFVCLFRVPEITEFRLERKEVESGNWKEGKQQEWLVQRRWIYDKREKRGKWLSYVEL